MSGQNAVVALTDRRWFDFLSSRATAGRLDEVNFWRPLAQTEFRALAPGEPFFFRLKHPINAIAGYAFFAHSTRLPISLAWEAFAQGNGDPAWEGFVQRIAEYRRETPAETLLGDRELTCLILREAHFLPQDEWMAWGEDREWSPNIVAFKQYDLTTSPGVVLAELLRNGRPAELVPAYEPPFQNPALEDQGPAAVREGRSAYAAYEPGLEDDRRWAERTAAVREGQGAFRVRVLDAYGRRCAVTGERSLPVLEAAHIQPYLGPASNHVQNGLSLRADIHRLYDAGYVTVTPDYRFQVSSRLRDEFENGRVYYELEGSPLVVVPGGPQDRPSQEALDWHASKVFR